jgi:hypothetical protein
MQSLHGWRVAQRGVIDTTSRGPIAIAARMRRRSTFSGVTHPIQAGVVTTGAGLLLQSTTTPGIFEVLQDLP